MGQESGKRFSALIIFKWGQYKPFKFGIHQHEYNPRRRRGIEREHASVAEGETNNYDSCHVLPLKLFCVKLFNVSNKYGDQFLIYFQISQRCVVKQSGSIKKMKHFYISLFLRLHIHQTSKILNEKMVTLLKRKTRKEVGRGRPPHI